MQIRNLKSEIKNPFSAWATVSPCNRAFLEITYDTGAKVILQGPVSYEVESLAGGYLSVGKLTAKLETKNSLPSPSGRGAGGEGGVNAPVASKSGISSPQPLAPSPSSNPQSLIPNPLFAVRTPTAVVTDLGTEFGVEVDKEGSTSSHVFRGSIRVQATSRDANTSRRCTRVVCEPIGTR